MFDLVGFAFLAAAAVIACRHGVREAREMGYRGFTMPAFASQQHSVADWMSWLEKEGVLVPAAPRPPDGCRTCGGAVGQRSDGGFWPTCFQCSGYGTVLDAFAPITYSTAAGLESMLHRFKDWSGCDWMRLPLGSLLYTFLSKHRACVDAQIFDVDIATFVPSNDRSRTFSPLDLVLDAIDKSPVRAWFQWDSSIIGRDFSVARPGRAEVRPDAYVVDAGAVRGKAVLLLDDTWTSGSSMVSSAAALKKAGASAVVGLTLGRQLNTGGHYGSTDKILANVNGRRWTDDDCVFCT